MVITGNNFVGYTLSSEGKRHYQGFNPGTLTELPEIFYDATGEETDRAMKLSSTAFRAYRKMSGVQKAEFLEAIATELGLQEDMLVQRAVQETGLTEPRLKGEIARTTGQLRLFADLIKEGSWVEATIDTAQPERKPVPKPDIRRMLVPTGPVVVFPAGNFPFAFSVAGGDTASALAGGNPVVVKVHPGHPGTSELVASAVIRAAKRTNMPEGTFSMLHGNAYEVGQRLVMHPETTAVGFTGSLQGGKALYDLAHTRPVSIPVFAEMGSINPVFILNGALAEKSDQIAEQLAGSITLGVGQFCTKPGLLIIQDGPGSSKFLDSLNNHISRQTNGIMLGKRISSAFRNTVGDLRTKRGLEFFRYQDDPDHLLKGIPALAKVSAGIFLKNTTLHEEVFGPFSMVVTCSTKKEMVEVAESLQGQLTVSVFAGRQEFSENKDLLEVIGTKAGRLIRNGVPTGVEVCPSMQHGGPFPSSTDQRFTSVGTYAIKRFVRPLAFQDWTEQELPPELRNDNPLGIWRILNGERTRDKV